MMGPEAALVSDRISELRALGRYKSPGMTTGGSIYAEAAARLHLEPFPEVTTSARWWGKLTRFAATVRHAGPRRAEPLPGWSVAASPIVTKGSLTGAGAEEEGAGLLAGLPLRALTQRP